MPHLLIIAEFEQKVPREIEAIRSLLQSWRPTRPTKFWNVTWNTSCYLR